MQIFLLFAAASFRPADWLTRIPSSFRRAGFSSCCSIWVNRFEVELTPPCRAGCRVCMTWNTRRMSLTTWDLQRCATRSQDNPQFFIHIPSYQDQHHYDQSVAVSDIYYSVLTIAIIVFNVVMHLNMILSLRSGLRYVFSYSIDSMG